MKKAIATLCILLWVLTVLAGCSSRESGKADKSEENSLEKVTLRLNWTAQGSHAPVFYGIKEGIFEKHGLDLTAGEGKGSSTTVNVIASKGDTFGWADAGTIFNLISQDAPVKMIGPVYTKSSFAVISIEENNIKKPEDLSGKRIGITEGDGPHKLFPAFLESVGVSEEDVTLIPMESSAKVTALLNNQVDAILGGFDDQPFAIEAKGFKPVVMAYSDYGVNLIGMSLVVNNDTLAEEPEMVKAFLQAYAESWVAAYKNPEAALDALIENFPDLDRDTCENQLNAGLELLLCEESKGILDIPESNYAKTIELCKQYMDLPEDVSVDELYSLDYIPEEPVTVE